MAIDIQKSDTERSIQHDPNMDWPESVHIQLCWRGNNGSILTSTESISADQFFGRGAYGAPLSGEYLIQAIERMRRAGPPRKTIP